MYFVSRRPNEILSTSGLSCDSTGMRSSMSYVILNLSDVLNSWLRLSFLTRATYERSHFKRTCGMLDARKYSRNLIPFLRQMKKRYLCAIVAKFTSLFIIRLLLFIDPIPRSDNTEGCN